VEFLSEPTLVVALLEIAFGVALLGWAADTFVEGAAAVACAARVSPILVGAVIIGFGTSAPELLVSGIAAFNGDLNLGVGNIVGSNVANITLVLGLAAMIVPLTVSRPVLIREAPVSLLSVLVFAYLATGGLERWEGIVLLVVLAASLAWLIGGGMGNSRPLAEDAAQQQPTGSVLRHSYQTVVGLAGTVAGAQLLVWGATALAETVGLTGGFIGFTLVALGTSLPELVTAVVAARKGATELLLGNLLGSNLFNSLAVGGVIAWIAPGAIDDRALRTIGMTVMVLVAVGAWVAMVTLRRVHRFEGVILMASWLVAVILMARTSFEDAFTGWLPG